MESHLVVRGFVQLTATRADRVLKPRELALAIERGQALPVTHSNTVLDVGLDALVALFGGGEGVAVVGGNSYNPVTVRDLAVQEMQITAQVSPTAADPADTALEGAAVWTANIQVGQGDGLLEVTYPGAGEVRFSAFIPLPNLVGVILTEEGLFTNDAKLLARTTFYYDRTSALGLQVDHTITLARA